MAQRRVPISIGLTRLVLHRTKLSFPALRGLHMRGPGSTLLLGFGASGLGFAIWEFPKIGDPIIVPRIVGSLL